METMLRDSPISSANRDKFVEIVSQVVDAVKRECNLLHEVKYHKMEYEPRIVNLLRHYSWGVSQQITLNNDFCWLQDTRFTRTGKIAKNAYVLNFWDNPVRDFLDYENYQVSFGEASEPPGLLCGRLRSCGKWRRRLVYLELNCYIFSFHLQFIFVLLY